MAILHVINSTDAHSLSPSSLRDKELKQSSDFSAEASEMNGHDEPSSDDDYHDDRSVASDDSDYHDGRSIASDDDFTGLAAGMTGVDIEDSNTKSALIGAGITDHDFRNLRRETVAFLKAPCPLTSTVEVLNSTAVDQALSILERVDRHIQDTAPVTLSEEDRAVSLTEAKVREMNTAVETAKVSMVLLSTARDDVEIADEKRLNMVLPPDKALENKKHPYTRAMADLRKSETALKETEEDSSQTEILFDACKGKIAAALGSVQVKRELRVREREGSADKSEEVHLWYQQMEWREVVVDCLLVFLQQDANNVRFE
ncbi:unnamed protein product [Zymoseptoria tritici ST99CH_1A5]|uniref:Uncharacterized protein n=1 Tax=Zymoseptoria tritici ST99CH_1A5 TaxID=1276529 RepID=A0A1Y6LIC0_ZYMTR|nr:unnamed protein product [Zymoseptoria tritici ST99CH_1A5]